MNLFLYRPGSGTLLTSLVGVMMLSSCVKQSEYDLVVNEKNDAQSRLAQKVEELQQAQVQGQGQQARIFQLINVQSTLQKREEELQQTRDELEALRAEFEKFREQRRSAMLGKKIPFLQLDNGRQLRDVELTSVSPLEVALRHEGGILKVALADTNDDLRWEACYDPAYAEQQARARFLTDAQRIDAELAQARLRPQTAMLNPEKDNERAKATAVQQMRTLIMSQRGQLNREFDAMKARNPVLKDADWNSSNPEASPLLYNFSSRRAVLGLSRLEMIRDVINDNVIRLRNLDPMAR